MSVYPYDDSEAPFVLVIGAMAVDAKGKPNRSLVPGTSTPGTVRLSIGGVARNIAENLVRLGLHTVLLSAVGDDPIGHLLLDAVDQQLGYLLKTNSARSNPLAHSPKRTSRSH